MEIFKQKRNYITTIVILVIINIVCLLLLWIGKPKHNKRGAESEIGEKTGIQEMLKEELGFTDEQANQFLELRENHKEKSDKVNDELMFLKSEMFEKAMYGKKETISDSLLNLSLEKQRKLEEITFDHFLKLKQICTPDQQEKLFELVSQLLGPQQQAGPHGPPPGELEDGMRPPKGGRPDGPPPRGERPPKRN